MFRNAIVRHPGVSVKEGLSSSSPGRPDYHKALRQHNIYTSELRTLGLDVRVLPADEQYPDSVFIEDVAICTPGFAVITSPGAVTRMGETQGMHGVLSDYFSKIEEIKLPGTLEGGDIMMAGDTYYIGISRRTNNQGADQLISILEKEGLKGIKVPLGALLHLKSGVSYLGNNNILVSDLLKDRVEFKDFNHIRVRAGEDYAANSLWINGTVLVPEGYPYTSEQIENAGYKTITIDVSEFRKVDGGVSCLSLRF
jgi:dimethylargininase